MKHYVLVAILILLLLGMNLSSVAGAQQTSNITAIRSKGKNKSTGI
jgi:hypothetical protein